MVLGRQRRRHGTARRRRQLPEGQVKCTHLGPAYSACTREPSGTAHLPYTATWLSHRLGSNFTLHRMQNLHPQVPKFMGGAEHALRAEVTLVASTRDKKPWGRPPIQLQFQVG